MNDPWIELATNLTVEAAVMAYRAVNFAHEVARINPVYRILSDAAFDRLFGPYEDWDDDAPRTV